MSKLKRKYDPRASKAAARSLRARDMFIHPSAQLNSLDDDKVTTFCTACDDLEHCTIWEVETSVSHEPYTAFLCAICVEAMLTYDRP